MKKRDRLLNELDAAQDAYSAHINKPMKPTNMKKPKLSADQIRGQIASQQAELGRLEREHADRAQQFQEQLAAGQKRHAELTGGIAALQSLLT